PTGWFGDERLKEGWIPALRANRRTSIDSAGRTSGSTDRADSCPEDEASPDECPGSRMARSSDDELGDRPPRRRLAVHRTGRRYLGQPKAVGVELAHERRRRVREKHVDPLPLQPPRAVA